MRNSTNCVLDTESREYLSAVLATLPRETGDSEEDKSAAENQNRAAQARLDALFENARPPKTPPYSNRIIDAYNVVLNHLFMGRTQQAKRYVESKFEPLVVEAGNQPRDKALLYDLKRQLADAEADFGTSVKHFNSKRKSLLNDDNCGLITPLGNKLPHIILKLIPRKDIPIPSRIDENKVSTDVYYKETHQLWLSITGGKADELNDEEKFNCAKVIIDKILGYWPLESFEAEYINNKRKKLLKSFFEWESELEYDFDELCSERNLREFLNSDYEDEDGKYFDFLPKCEEFKGKLTQEKVKAKLEKLVNKVGAVITNVKKDAFSIWQDPQISNDSGTIFIEIKKLIIKYNSAKTPLINSIRSYLKKYGSKRLLETVSKNYVRRKPKPKAPKDQKKGEDYYEKERVLIIRKHNKDGTYIENEKQVIQKIPIETICPEIKFEDIKDSYSSTSEERCIARIDVDSVRNEVDSELSKELIQYRLENNNIAPRHKDVQKDLQAKSSELRKAWDDLQAMPAKLEKRAIIRKAKYKKR